MPSMRPRRELRSPMIVPAKSSGVTTSTAMTGSSRTGEALRAASLNAIDPAILNSIFHRLPNPLVHRLDVFLGHDSAYDVIHKLIACTRLLRLQTDFHMSIL